MNLLLPDGGGDVRAALEVNDRTEKCRFFKNYSSKLEKCEL
jgi:hypothetical protein